MKPSCARPATAVLAYDYAARKAILEDPPEGELSPHVYAVCTICADKLTPPNGWKLSDDRAIPPLFLDRGPVLSPAAPPREAEVSGTGSRRQMSLTTHSA